jgi:hypothetical protein
MRKVTIIDPPSGWRYGFPKELTVREGQTFYDWLIEQGYPKQLMDSLGEQFFCSQWEEEVED